MVWITFSSLIGLIWVLPLAVVAISDRVHGRRKVLWSIGVLFTSWLGFVVFLLATNKPCNGTGAALGKEA